MEKYPNVDVFKYSEDALRENLFPASKFIPLQYDLTKNLDAKANYAYLISYLGNREINATTIIRENEYVDNDYLLDYSKYYSECFAPYNRYCTRLHFFSMAITKRGLLNIVSNLDKREVAIKKMQRNYIGFITLKPLPMCLIGRTCLKAYENSTDENGCAREYTFKHKYLVNLFGIRLKIKTLAFQEQDSTVAACATTSLWSALNATGRFYQHAIHSPAEITEIANEVQSSSRTFPSEGLNLYQMLHVFIKHDIAPKHYGTIYSRNGLLSRIYPYTKCSIPVILNLALYKGTSVDDLEYKGLHSIVVSGFCIDAKKPIEANTKLPLYSSKIIKLYAHDDNVGPFSRIHVLDETTEEGYKLINRIREISAKPIKEPRKLDYVLKYGIYDNLPEPHGLILGVQSTNIIPLHPKMRITSSVIYKMCKQIFAEINYLVKKKLSLLPAVKYWDAHLETVYKYKEMIQCDSRYKSELKKKIMTASLPKYLWYVRACDSEEDSTNCAFEMLLDATDILSENMLIFLFTRDIAIRENFEKTVSSFFREHSILKILDKIGRKSSGIRIDSLGE